MLLVAYFITVSFGHIMVIVAYRLPGHSTRVLGWIIDALDPAKTRLPDADRLNPAATIVRRQRHAKVPGL